MPNVIDLPRCTSLWSEQDRALFYQLPLYMAKTMVDYIQYQSRFTKILKPQKWQANMGNTMQGVRKVASPIMRSMPLPNLITQMPKKDVIEIRETAEKVNLYRHNFESLLLNFVPSFADFLTDHVDKTNEDITNKVMIYIEQFYRAAIFHGAPAMWICGKATELTPTIYWPSPSIAFVKDANVMQQLCALATKPLDLKNVSKINTVMYNDIGVQPFTGNSTGDGADGTALKHKYCLIMGSEVWDTFQFDPLLTANRQLDLDIITDQFTGSLFGRFTTLFERFELRVALDGTFPQPEVIEENPTAYNFGEPVMNPTYVNAPWGIAWACGNEAYKYIQVGPPPKDFAGVQTMAQFNGLDWNGKVSMTRNVMINCLDGNGAVVQDLNKRGEFLQLLADASMGILPIQRRNIIPILYKRQRIAANL